MRQKIVAGNWKMNTLVNEGMSLIAQIAEKKNAIPSDVKVIIAPPFTHLCCGVEKIKGTSIGLSAQNCANMKSGAYTGEISAAMLQSIGCQYVILGHSERRQYYGDTSPILIQKIKLALEAELIPIFCIGETLSERESNNHFTTVQSQIEEVVFQLTDAEYAKIIIAYEPVWAIGTGKVATPQQAQEMHAFIRKTLLKKYNAATQTPLLYGGSCNPSNAKEIFAQPDVDGGLIGGASLKADDFIALTQSF